MVLQGLIRRSVNGDRAAEATDAQSAAPRPSVGLALGGGIARGFAHIGILRVLAKHGIEPDVVVGTSIGAVVGACYAAGKLDALDEWARGLTTRGVLGYLDVSLGGSGLIGGNRLAERLEGTLADTLIEELPKRYAAIATELGTGHEIWLTRGRVVDAARASYALPGLFTPVRLGGRWLVDGALVNPVPVSAARALGARLVIAINLNSDMLGRGGTVSDHGPDDYDARLLSEMRTRPAGLRRILSPEFLLKRQLIGNRRSPNIASIMIDSFNIMQDRVTRSRLAGDPPDVMIAPRTGKIGLFDFHRAKEAIEIGTQTAERAIPDIVDAIAALT
ncbi:patatin-like phospholipase family protein [Pseudorhodoplanes sp.]|uniref:patatin-like phospholipase family protein n=1 Tax=Pseudorhodoplanes sp. TaxID=1934341 RepID=UPI00391DCA82